MASELYLMEVGDGRYSILLCDDRSITQMPAMTPAESLIAFSELDYADYRKTVRWLRDKHPLFEERIDIPVSDLEDFAAETILLTPDLHEIDPVSGFVVTDILHWTLQAEDDGTAMFLLAAGQAILRVMEEPLRVQNYFRNIMEVTFDGTAGMTPTEQYEKLRATYTDIAQTCDPAKLPQSDEPRSFQLRTTYELTSYEVDKIDLPDEPSLWQRLVARDFRFDLERYFSGKMAYLNWTGSDSQWQILTAEDQRREMRKGHQSLKEKYGK